MDAFAITDKLGHPVVDDGYLSFVCEENDNIVRVDPNQIDLCGSEPYLVEHEGVKYKLYLYKHPDEVDNKVVSEVDPSGMNIEPADVEINHITKTTKVNCFQENQIWDKESAEVLMIDLYREIADSISFTFPPEIDIWEKISKELRSRGLPVSPDQVKKRIKSIEMGHQVIVKPEITLQCESEEQETQTGNQFITNRFVDNIFTVNEKIANDKQSISNKLQTKREKLQKSNNVKDLKKTVNMEKIYPVFCKDSAKQDFTSLSKNKKQIEWSEETVQLLLNLYQKYSIESNKVGKHASNMQLWCKISEDFKLRGYSYSAVQMLRKWRNLTAGRDFVKQHPEKNAKTLHHSKGFGVKIEKDHKKMAFEDLENLGMKEEKSTFDSGNLPLKEENKTLDPDSIRIEDSKVFLNHESNKAVWSEKQAEILIDVYGEITEKHSLLRYRSKKYLWEEVAQELMNRGQNFTPRQVQNKWKSLQRSLKTKLEKLERVKLDQTSFSTCDRFNLDVNPVMEEQHSFTQLGSKPFGLPLEVVLKDSSDEESEPSDEDSEPLRQSCSDNVEFIESLNKLMSMKEKYYKDRLLLKAKKLKAFEERTIEIRERNKWLEQLLKK